jgi:hypothetical protein
MEKELSPMAQHIFNMATGHGNMIRAGIQAEQERMRPAVRLLQRTYLEASGGQAKLPIPLELAIEAVLRSFAEGVVNEYANARITADKHARHEGKPEHDMTTRGERMKAGA